MPSKPLPREQRLVLACLAKGTNAEHVLGYQVALDPVFRELFDLGYIDEKLSLTETGHIEAEWCAFNAILRRSSRRWKPGDPY
jgi:hypothetical protein